MTIGEFIEENGFLGGDTDICSAIKMLNAARRVLWKLDDWVGTIGYGCVNTNAGCFYLPSHIETARYVYECDKNLPLHDEIWYHLDANELNEWCGRQHGVIQTDIFHALPVGIPYKAQIGFKPQDESDIGTIIPITIKNPVGSTRTERLELKGLDVVSFTEDDVSEVISIAKKKTSGRVSVYSLSAGKQCKLYTLEADEVTPKYRVYKSPCTCSCLVVKGKKKFFPYNEEDLDRDLDLDPSGVAFAQKALMHQKSNAYNEYAAALKIARSHLERAKEDLGQKQGASKPSKWYPTGTDTTRYGY